MLSVEKRFVLAMGCVTVDFWTLMSWLQAPACPPRALLGPQSQAMRHLLEVLEWGHPVALGPHSISSACTLLAVYCCAKPFMLRGFGCELIIEMVKKGRRRSLNVL